MLMLYYLFIDLMRSVENYETDHLSVHDESFQVPSHSNINDK